VTNLGALYDSVSAVYALLRRRSLDGQALDARDLYAIVGQLRRAGVAASACSQHREADDEDPAP